MHMNDALDGKKIYERSQIKVAEIYDIHGMIIVIHSLVVLNEYSNIRSNDLSNIRISI